MQKKLLGILLVLCMLLSILPFAFGASAEDDVTLISTADELVALMGKEEIITGNYKLANSIDLSEIENQAPIGISEAFHFSGTFDGDGYSITGINMTVAGYGGLFGYARDAEIKNLTISGTITATGANVGGFVGFAHQSGLIENCVNNCVITTDDMTLGAGNTSASNIGGIVGYLRNTYTNDFTIKNCTNNAAITGYRNVGGIVGWHNGHGSGTATFENCRNYGVIADYSKVAGGSNVGGIIGVSNGEGTSTNITKCFNDGDVTGYFHVGGILGAYIGHDTSASSTGHKMTICWNDGAVTSTRTGSYAYTGGLIGTLQSLGYVRDCLNTGVVTSTVARVGGLFGGHAATTYLGIGNCLNAEPVVCAVSDNYVNSIGGYLPAKPTGTNYYIGELQGQQWVNGDAKSTQYTEELFDDLNADGNWIDLATPELAFFHTTETCEINRGYYVDLGNGYHAPACHCGSLETADAESKAEHTYGDDGACSDCGALEPFDSKIESADEFIELMSKPALWSGDYTLETGIDLTGKAQTPIGTADIPFMGSFDGQGNTISGVSITSESDYAGLFGYIEDATITNLKVSGTVSGTNYVGGVIGYVSEGCSVSKITTVEGSVTGATFVGGVIGSIGTSKTSFAFTGAELENNFTVSATGQYSGGVVSYFKGANTVRDGRDSILTDCVNNATVTGTIDVSGVVGVAWGSSIENAENNGAVTGTQRAAGILARYTGYLSVVNSVNTAVIKGEQFVGGILGQAQPTTEPIALLSGCYNGGNLEATSTTQADIGGIAGLARFMDIVNCQNAGSVTASAKNAGGLVGRGGTSLTIMTSYTTKGVTTEVTENVGTIIGNVAGTFTNVYYATGLTEDTNGTAYTEDAFKTLDADGVWCNAAAPELLLVHDHATGENREYVQAGDAGHYFACPCGKDNGEVIAHTEGDTCADCGYTSHSHTENATSEITTPATCDTKGVRTYTCTCGETWTEEVDLDSNNHAHNTNYDWAWNGDAENPKYFLECSVCDGNAIEQTVAPKIYVDNTSEYGDGNIGDDANDGLTLDTEVKTINGAIARISECGGTIVLTDRYYVSSSITFSEHKEPITITSAANGGSAKTGFYISSTVRFHLGGDMKFEYMYFWANTNTEYTVVFVAGWNDLTMGTELATSVRGLFIAGLENCNQDAINATKDKNESTVTLYGVNEWAEGTGDKTTFESVPRFYDNVYLGNRYNVEPGAAYKVSDKTVTLKTYSFQQSENVRFDTKINTLYATTTAVHSSPVLQIENCTTTINAYDKTEIKNLRTAWVNITDTNAYLSGLTVNLSDDAIVTDIISVQNVKAFALNISNGKADYTGYPENSVSGTRSADRKLLATANNWHVSFSNSGVDENGNRIYIYQPDGTETAVINYGSHSFTSTDVADGLVGTGHINENYVLGQNLTVNLVNECTDGDAVVVAPADGKNGTSTVTCSVCGDADVTVTEYECAKHGHGGYVATADGVVCSYCKATVDAPVVSETVPAVLALAPATAKDGKVTVDLSVDTDDTGIWAATFNIVAPAGYTLDIDNVDASKLEAQGFSFWYGDAYLCIAKIGQDESEATEDMFANGKLTGVVLSLPYTVADDAEEGVFDLVVTEVTRSVGDTEEDIAFVSVDAEVTIAAAPVPGDVTGEGKLTVVDALLILKALLNETAIDNADITGDGEVSLADVVRVLRNITE